MFVSNDLVKFLEKPSSKFTKEDIVKYCLAREIQFVNFHYVGWDGNLKTLNFIINSVDHLKDILEAGERISGKRLFPFMNSEKNDLYVVPRYRTAFLNPFSETPSVDMLCSFFTRDGEPFDSSPEYILRKAHNVFKSSTGLHMQAMGELEYYIISEDENKYSIPNQNGYHESAPFNKFSKFRTEAMKLIASTGGVVKYGHSETGNFVLDGKLYEQNEIEFLPVDIEEAADQIVIAKWIMFQLAYKYGLTLSFTPKITLGESGTGLHIHCKFLKDGKPVMTEGENLTEECKKAIAGFMIAGSSLPAFGNPEPISYIRLKEMSNDICWSFSSRSAIVRIPLGWTNTTDMASKCNPLEKESPKDFSNKQTFEWRVSDALSNIYLLMAALCCAARQGFECPDFLSVLYRTFADKHKSFKKLPKNCKESAKELSQNRLIYTSEDVFPDEIIDYTIKQLTFLES